MMRDASCDESTPDRAHVLASAGTYKISCRSLKSCSNRGFTMGSHSSSYETSPNCITTSFCFFTQARSLWIFSQRSRHLASGSKPSDAPYPSATSAHRALRSGGSFEASHKLTCSAAQLAIASAGAVAAPSLRTTVVTEPKTTPSKSSRASTRRPPVVSTPGWSRRHSTSVQQVLQDRQLASSPRREEGLLHRTRKLRQDLA
jgi:hypothetical protein